ncbi:MAG: N-acetylmuramoyl-L-alanine amidase [Planctomycetes bacterium]|nr:N-acetylmuramoyl-L-alanine amidase [Planctomycetota bacterium]
MSNRMNIKDRMTELPETADTLGVCVVGNFENDMPGPQQVSSLVRVLADWCQRYHVEHTQIFGHRDLGHTACPGKNLYAQLPSIRQDVRNHGFQDFVFWADVGLNQASWSQTARMKFKHESIPGALRIENPRNQAGARGVVGTWRMRRQAS